MTADTFDRSIRVHSAPQDRWFSTEVETITNKLLTERNEATESDVVGEQMHALTRLAVRVLARRGEPFTVYDIWQVIEQREIPIPAKTTSANVETLWRRLSRRIERANAARRNGGGQI